MSSSLPIYLRSHTVSSTTAEPKPLALLKQKQLKWPTFVLVVDCETRIDVSQALTFGCARFCRLETNGRYQCVQEILFYADDTPRRDAEGFESLCEYARQHASDALAGDDILQVVSRSEFIEKYFWRTLLDAKGMIVCFNAPFDIS